MKNSAADVDRLDVYRRIADQFVGALEPEDMEALVERGKDCGDMADARRYLIMFCNARDRATGRKPPTKPRALRRTA